MPKTPAARLFLLAATLLLTPAPALAQASPVRHVVLIGVPGLQWSDVGPDTTPNLWRLAERSATGVLSVKAVGTLTCPNDAWATISAGARSAAGPYCERPITVSPTASAGAVVAEADEIRRANAGFGPVGLLGDAVHRAGGCTTAVGAGAALAAAGTGGRVDAYYPSPDEAPAAAWARCAVTIADAGPVARAGDPARVDRTVGAVLSRIPAGTDVVVAGVADQGRPPHLRVLMTTGSAGRYLGSDSTRRADMAILPDLTATLLASANVPAPAQLIGRPVIAAGERPRDLRSAVAELGFEDVAAQTHRNLLPRFFAGFVIGQVLLYGGAALALWWQRRRRGDGRGRILAATRLTALAAAAVPVSAYLVDLLPWWRTGHPAIWLTAGIAGIDVLIVAVAVAGPWRRVILGPGTVVAGLTAAVLGGDLLTGSRLQLNSLMGYSPLVGGRYYGMGNIAFAVLATSTLLAAAGVAHWLEPLHGRRVAVTAVLAMTITAAVLDSWTAWGSDFGGLIAFVPGLATTALLVAGRRVSFIRLQLLRATGMALVLGMAYVDHLRPPSRQTHMGRFWGQLVEGNALPWLERKFTAMAHTFGNPTLLPIIIVAVLFLTLVLHRPGRAGAGGLQLAYERAPMLRAGLSGAFVTALVGGAVNDSGIAVPALTLAVAVPLALAAAVLGLEQNRAP